MRVLIVEDSDSVRRMIEALVAARGYEVKSASSGSRGLEEAFAWRPHVVLVDLDLAGSYDGFEVCKKLQGDEGTKDTPVIFLGAANDEDVRRRAAACGAQAFYEKPFSPLALLKEIEALARRSERALKASVSRED